MISKGLEGFWRILKHFERFWSILKDFEAIWSILKFFEGFWRILKDFERFWRILKDSARFPDPKPRIFLLVNWSFSVLRGSIFPDFNFFSKIWTVTSPPGVRPTWPATGLGVFWKPPSWPPLEPLEVKLLLGKND